MVQICAWCRAKIKEVANTQCGISHGICENCYDNIRFQEGAPLGEYVNSLPEPVYVVDGNGMVQGVNRMGCKVLGKDPSMIVRHLGGDVFECAYARLPEGCGRTIHCSGCTIRRTVMRTFDTGQPQSRVPAVLNQGDADEPTPVKFIITTIKYQGFVFLRVDDMSH